MDQDKFKNWIKNRLPSLPEYDTQESDDLFEGMAKVFSDIHSEISSLAGAIDIDETENKYLPEIARTLGIQDKIASKITFRAIGGRNFTSDFEDYSIYTRIEQRIAHSEEIELLKDFIKNTLQRNLSKGTPDALENIFNLLKMDAKIVPRWTDDYPDDTTEIIDVFGINRTRYDKTNNDFLWDDVYCPEHSSTDTSPFSLTDIEGYLARRMTVDSVGDVVSMYTNPENKTQKLKNGTLEMSFAFSGITPSKKAHIIFRAQRDKKGAYDVTEYYIAGVGLPIDNDPLEDPKIVLAKVSYESGRGLPYYEIVAQSETKAKDIATNERVKLVVEFDESTVTCKLIEGFTPGIQEDFDEKLEVDLNTDPENVTKHYLNGICFLTEKQYDSILDGGSYGFRLQNTHCSIFSYSARPKKSWPTTYSYEKDLRKTVKPYFLDHYGGEIFKYDNTKEMYQSNFNTIDDFEWSHLHQDGNRLIYINGGFVYDTTTSTASVTSTSSLTSESTASSANYSLTETEQVNFKAEVDFQFNSFIEDAGVVFGIDDIFDETSGDWKKSNTMMKLEFNKWGFDVVLSKVIGGEETFMAGTNLSEDLVTGTIYKLVLSRTEADPIYLSEITGNASDTTTISNQGSRIRVNFGHPGNTKEIIHYNSNRKDAYFTTTGGTSGASATDSTVQSASAYYDRLGVVRGTPPDPKRDTSGDCFTNYDIIQEKDPVGKELGLLSKEGNISFQNLVVENKDSETHWTYNHLGNFSDDTDLLFDLKKYYTKPLLNLTTESWSTSGTSTSATSGTSGTIDDDFYHKLNSRIKKIKHTTGQESNTIVQIDTDLFVRRADQNYHQLAVENVSDFRVQNEYVIIHKTDGTIEVWDSNTDEKYEPQFESKQIGRFSYNEFLKNQRLKIARLIKDRDDILVQLTHGENEDGVKMGDTITFRKVFPDGTFETRYGNIQNSTNMDVHHLEIKDDGSPVFTEHLRIPKHPSKIHLLEQDTERKDTFFVYEEDSHIWLDVIQDHTSWSKRKNTNQPPYYSFSEKVCKSDQFIDVFRGKTFEDTIFIFYTDEFDETHVANYSLDSNILIENLIAEDVTIHDIVHVNDGFIMKGKDNNHFQQLFLLYEKDTKTGDDIPEGRTLHIQPFDIPDYAPYQFRNVEGQGTSRTEWYISGSVKTSGGSPNFYSSTTTESTATSGNITKKHLRLKNQSKVLGQMDETLSPNIAVSTQFKINSIHDDTINICKLYDDESSRFANIQYSPETKSITADFQILNTTSESYPLTGGEFDLDDGDMHSLTAGAIREDDKWNLTVCVDGNVVAESSHSLISDYDVDDLYSKIWNEVIEGKWLEIEFFNGNMDVEAGHSMVLSGNSINRKWLQSFSYHMNSKHYSVKEKGKTDSTKDHLNGEYFTNYVQLEIDDTGYRLKDYPVFIKVDSKNINFDKIRNGKNIRIVRERGDTDYFPFQIVNVDKTRKKITLAVMFDEMSQSERNVTLYYGSDYNERLNNFQDDENQSYENYLNNSYEMISGSFINKVGRVRGVIFNPDKYVNTLLESRKEKGLRIFETKHNPIILTLDTGGDREWLEMEKLGFYGKKNIWSSKDFELKFQFGTELSGEHSRLRTDEQKIVEDVDFIPPDNPSAGDYYLVNESAFNISEIDSDSNLVRIEGQIDMLEGKTFTVHGNEEISGEYTLRSDSTYDVNSDETTLMIEENIHTTSDEGIVMASGGEWGGKNQKIAYYNGSISEWEFTEPREGSIIYVRSINNYKSWNGSSWTGALDAELSGLPNLSKLRNYLNDFVENQKPAYTTWKSISNALEYKMVDYLYEEDFIDTDLEYKIKI